MDIDEFFQAGGAVSRTAPSYISRECDERALRAVSAQRYVCILGPRQIGKTSLLYGLQWNLQLRGLPSAFVDLSILEGAGSAFGPASSPPAERKRAATWFQQLATQIADQFDERLPDVVAPRDATSFMAFLNGLGVVAEAESRAVIMLDEAAAVPTALKTSFYMSLRALFNARADSRRAHKLVPATRIDFVFAGAFYPSALVTDPRVSPFNVSQTILPSDFTRSEVSLLLNGFERLRIHLVDGVGDEIWDAAAGHPFLTQRICQELSTESTHEIRLETVRAKIDIVLRNDAHLYNLVRLLDENPSQLSLVRRVMGNERIRLNPIVNPAAAELEMLGILKLDSNGYAQIRNRMYERLLQTYLAERMN